MVYDASLIHPTRAIKGDKKSPALLEKVRVKKGSHLSGVKLGKDVKLEKGVRVEQQTK